jgi:hypothetical protein
MQEFAQAPSTLLFDSFVRVYFSCRPAADRDGKYVSYSAYVDLDRADLFRILRVSDRPILPLGGLGDFDEFGIYPVSVIRTDQDVRAYYAGWTRCESVPFNVAIGCARSTDGGSTFERIGSGPILGASLDEPFVISGPKVRRFNDRWYLWYIAGRKWKIVAGRPEPVYKIRTATSDDGLRWQRMSTDPIESRIEEDEAQASPDVFYAAGRYHMFFSYRGSEDYRGRANGYRIGYAWSSDLVRWERQDDRVGIGMSDCESDWDAQMVAYPHVFEVDDRIYMAYLGNEVGRFGFGLAVLDGRLE